MAINREAAMDEQVFRLIDAALNLQQAGEQMRALEILQEAQKRAPQYAPIHLLIGLLYRDQERFEEAEARLRHAVKLDPEQSEAIQSLGLLLATQGRSPEAVELFKRHAKLLPDDLVTLKALGSQLARLGRQDEGIKILQEAWCDTQDTGVGITYGRYLIRFGHWKEAENALRQVADAAPEPEPLVELAYVLVLLDQCDEALQVLQGILEIDASFDRAWRGTSTCHLNLGRPSEALEAAERALAIDGCHCRNWLAKSNALLSLGRHAEVLEAAQIGADCVSSDDEEAQPVLKELRLRAVEALFQLDREDEALDQLETIRRQFPADERLLHIQVSALNDRGRSEKALGVLDEAQVAGRAADSSLAPLRYETLHLVGKPDEAWAFIQPALEGQAEHRLDVLGAIGVSLYERENIEAARAVFEQLSAFAPHAHRFDCNLGFILVGEGDIDGAKQCLSRMLEASDNPLWNALALANLGYLHLVQGDHSAAEEALERAEALVPEESTAILRIAYWRKGQVVPDFTRHPTRWVPMRTAIMANQVTLALAQGRVKEAEALARRMMEQATDEPWGYEMLGWVLSTTNRFEEARDAWETAHRTAASPQAKRVIEDWLQSLAQE